MSEKLRVFVVDDDQAISEGVVDLLEGVGYDSAVFSSPDDFLRVSDGDLPDCLVLDVRMPGMSGIDLLQHLFDRDLYVPAVFVTGHGDIQMAVKAMDIGAIDFLEKPFREQQLLDSISKAIAVGAKEKQKQIAKTDLNKKLELLTDKENEVVKCLVGGMPDKQIAHKMEVTRRAVAFHRTSLLEKTGFVNVVELTAYINRYDISI